MHRQRGFLTTPVIITFAAIALSALVLAGGAYFTNSLIAKGVKSGRDACEAAYTARDKKQLEDALAKVTQLQKAKDKLEEEARAESSALQRLYKEKLNENRDLASRNKFLTGSLKLRDSAFVSTADSHCGSESKDTATASGSDGASACDLSAGAKQRLRDIGLRADKTAIQLSTCQQLLLSNVRVCNAE